MRADRRGFTLLEMLVSLTILAGIAGILAVAFRLASASVARGGEEARETARLRAAIGIVTRTVRSAESSLVPVAGKPGLCFVGERDRIRFLSAVPLAASGGGYRLVAFFEAKGPDGEGLAAAEGSPFRTAGADTWEGASSRRMVLRGAGGLAFSYSEGPSPEGEWTWEESWDAASRRRLPAAVRVEFESAREDGSRIRTAFVVTVPAGGMQDHEPVDDDR